MNGNDGQGWIRNQISQDNEYKFLMLYLHYIMIVTLTVILAVETENCKLPFDKIKTMALIEALLVFSALLSIPWASDFNSNLPVKQLVETIRAKLADLLKVNTALVIIILFMIITIGNSDGKVPGSCSIPIEHPILTAYIVVMCVNCAVVPLYLKYVIDDQFIISVSDQ